MTVGYRRQNLGGGVNTSKYFNTFFPISFNENEKTVFFLNNYKIIINYKIIYCYSK